MEFLEKILEQLMSLEAGGLLTMIAIVVELALRFVKSSKPLSILYAVSAALKVIASIVSKAAELLDKILPQRIK